MKPETKESIDLFVEMGIPPGGFLTSVLSNDLFGAIGRADYENQRDLVEICGYVYNEIPSNCWGSPEAMKEWAQKFLQPNQENP